MAMRITTKMMQSRSLNNLNTNKSLQERLTTQLSTGKKLTRPSEDPVVAIRSLKLNSSLAKVDQYYEKNTKDAESWLKLTESALDTTNQILKDMRTYFVQASTGHLESKDRQAIVENLSNFRTEIYSTGNADSAGRSIFTGYRTSTPLTIQEDKKDKCGITEQLTNDVLGMTTFIKTGDISTINEGNFKDKVTTEYGVEAYSIPRIRLSYNNLDFDQTKVGTNDNPAKLDISFRNETELINNAGTMGTELETTNYKMFIEEDAGGGDTTTIHLTDLDGNNPCTLVIDNTTGTLGATSDPIPADLGISFVTDANDATKKTLSIKEKDANGVDYKTTEFNFTVKDNKDGTFTNEFASFYETKLTVTDFYRTASDEAYLSVVEKLDANGVDENANKITYIAETGELLFGKNIQKQLAALKPTAEIRASYEKTDWKKGDLNPIHYFYTERTDEDTGKPLVYNEELLVDKSLDSARQIINYDIGSNQSIRVNTMAREVFDHGIGRDVDEVLAMLEKYDRILETEESVKGMMKSGKYIGDELEHLTKQKDALSKAAAELKDKIEKTCQGMLTGFDGYIKKATLATTDVGSRESRLKLVQNRLGQQQTNFQELVSENEDADITELAIQLKSVELTYQASLSSISYVLKTSLLDFI